MFKTFFTTELKSALKQPMIYIFLGLIALLVFGAVSSDNVQIGGSVGNVYRNSPHIITNYTTIMTIFGLLIATAFFNNASLRDFNHGFNEIIFTTPLKKSGYFFGRFFGALLLATIPMLGVFLGIILGSILAPAFGWIDPERFGSLNFMAFVNNYFLFVLPNMFFAGAIIYAIANKWRSTVFSFLGTLIIILAYIISGTFTSDLENETLAMIVDTFGIRAYSLFSKYYTPAEKNTLVPPFEGLLLLNRVIWVLVGTAVLSLSYFTFSFKERKRSGKKGKDVNSEGMAIPTQPRVTISPISSNTLIHFFSFFKTNFLSITKGVTFVILFLFSAIILIANLVGGFEYFGLQSYPLTYKIIDLISNASTLYVIIILVFYSGELIWRDRDSHINEVIDATPHSSLVSLFAKALSLVSVTLLIHLFFIFCGIVYQLVSGFTRIEIDVYLLDLLFGYVPLYFVLGGFMIFIQVAVNNKYLGYFVSIGILFATDIVLAILDIETNMLSLGDTPSLRYSDMNGFGPGLTSAIWFNIYWVFFSLLCLMFAGMLWNRGVKASFKDKIKRISNSTTKSYRLTFAGTFVVWLLLLGFIYYNTQVLNTYQTSDETEQVQVEYERAYKKYESAPFPKIAELRYEIDIFPHDRDVFVNADMLLANDNDVAIDSIHYTYDKRWSPVINIDGAELVFDDDKLGYRIYKLDEPFEPGDTIKANIKTEYVTRGFENSRGNTSIVRNGTFLNSFDVLPVLGYSNSYEISDNNTRKKYDLVEKERMPSLQHTCNELCNKNYLSSGRSGYIHVETIISTSSDQIAIAPGSLRKEWKEGDRNYYHYAVDHPSENFYSFISADYEVAKRKWNGVDIEVYHDEKHDVNVEMMLDVVQASLEYYTENFGPYYHKQCRIVEFPRYANFAQAFPGTMPYSESFGFVVNLEDEEKNNVIEAVIAHEMAHQWWAHQLIGAEMQGGTMLSESFAEYSSLMVMKNMGADEMQMREFLKYDHDRYLRGRSGEREKELPLYKVENQAYIHYGKGSVILYALQEYIGEDSVNKSLRTFLDEYKYRAPYPTSLDYLRHLEDVMPDSLNYLVDEWFKEITLYDNRLKEAEYRKLDNGKYEISLAIESHKIKADSLGNETKEPIDKWVEVGLFADEDEKKLSYLKRYRIRKPETTITLQVDSLPEKAAIDPKYILIDRVYKDNVKSLSEGS